MSSAPNSNIKSSDHRKPDVTRKEITAVLLVGGMGTRLRSVVPSAPKPLARVGHNSFLHLLVRQLQSQGIRNLVMCSGYLADQIEEEFGDGRKFDVSIQYSKETCPLGTAGAVKLAEHHLQKASDFLVMNGDSFVELDFDRFIYFHREHGSQASIVVRKVENATRYGTVRVDPRGRIIGFIEKSGAAIPGVVNAGVYMFNRAVLDRIPHAPSSLERDVFPQLMADGLYAFEQQGLFIDIGTPEDYARAQKLSDRLYRAALRDSDSNLEDL